MLSPLWGTLGALGQKYGGAAVSPYLNGLTHAWYFDETTGIRVDAIGSAHLTDNNTVGVSPRGPSGVVGNFVRASSEYLERTNVTGTAEWTISIWYKGTTVDDYDGIFLLSNGWDVPTNFMLYRYPTGNGTVLSVRLVASNTVPTAFTAQQANAGRSDVWHHLLGTFDGTTLSFYVDNGAPVTQTLTGTIYTAAATLRVGATMQPRFANGEIARAGRWNRVFTAQERASLYNAGNGKSYADLTATEKVGLISYHNMIETSGDRIDSHGTDTLTDINTVGSVTATPGAMRNAAASFIGVNNEYLSSTAVSVEGYSGFTAAGWLYVDPAQSGDPATGCWSGASGWNMYGLHAGSGVITPRFYCYGNGQNDFVTWGSAITAATFHHYLVYYDGSVIGIQIDGGTPVTVAHTVPPDDSFFAFNIGRTPDGAGYLTGRWDEFYLWSRALTATERPGLYNSGVGRFHPSFA